MALRESDLNGCCPKEKVLVCVLEEGKIWRGRGRKRSMGACPLWNNSRFSYLFHFFLLCFSPFYLRKYTLFFDPFYRARQEPFYSACRDHGFTVLPFNCLCLVWAYLPTTRGVCHSPLPDRGRFQFCPAVALLSCHGINAFSLYSQSMHQRFPLKLASFRWSIIPAGRTSQKRLGQEP